jgi:hypothetical protein
MSVFPMHNHLDIRKAAQESHSQIMMEQKVFNIAPKGLRLKVNILLETWPHISYLHIFATVKGFFWLTLAAIWVLIDAPLIYFTGSC